MTRVPQPRLPSSTSSRKRRRSVTTSPRFHTGEDWCWSELVYEPVVKGVLVEIRPDASPFYENRRDQREIVGSASSKIHGGVWSRSACSRVRTKT